MQKKIFLFATLFFCVNLLTAQVNFQHNYSLDKPTSSSNFKIIQLFDYDNDVSDDVVTQYWDNDEDCTKIMIFNQAGTLLSTLSFDYLSGGGDYIKVKFFNNNDSNKMIYAHINDYENLLEVVIKDINALTTIDSINFEPYAYWTSLLSLEKFTHDGVTSFALGYNRGFLDYTDTVMRRFNFIDGNLEFIELFYDCGFYSIQPDDNTILSIGWDSQCFPPTGGSIGFCLEKLNFENESNRLHSINGTLYYEDTTNVYNNFPTNYSILSKNFEGILPHILQYCTLDTYDGDSVHFKAYETTNWQELWSKTDTEIGLGNVTASTCIQVNDEDHYVMYFRGDKLEIRDRLTGNIIHHQDSVLAVFDVLRKSDGELLFFVEKDDETGYDVYSLDSPIFVSNDEPQPQDEVIIEQYPNPFNSSITISFNLKNPIQNPEIKVYNIKGQLVRELRFNASSLSRFYEVTWDGKDKHGNDVAEGIYLYEVKTDKDEFVGKIVKVE